MTDRLDRAIELAEQVAPGLSLPAASRAGQTLVAATDLDRTLLYSAAALNLTCADADAPDLVVSEVYNAVPLSYMTARAAAILDGLSDVARLVPTTTRTRAQYARVKMPGRPHKYVITSNGAHLLVDGRPDPDWSASIKAALAQQCAPLAEVAAHVEAVFLDEFTKSRKVAEDVFVYAVLHHRDQLPKDLVPAVTDWCAQRGWTVSLQGRKVYCVPGPLTKTAAVAEVGRREGTTLVVATGDSLLDGVMMDAAVEGIRPAHGELHDTGWERDHVVVTRQAGVLAGEEIAARLLAAALTGSVYGATGKPAPPPKPRSVERTVG